MKAILNRKIRCLAALVLMGLAGLAWWQRGPALAWYHVRQMSRATDGNREDCASKVASLEADAIPPLLRCLCDTDPAVCANVQYPLILIVKKWGHDDERTQDLAELLRTRFDTFSPAGQEKVVQALTCLLQQDGRRPLPPRLTKEIGELLVALESKAGLRAPAMLLAAELVRCVEPGQFVDVGRAMAERGLKDASADCRVAALRLLLSEPMRKDKELLEKSIPLLRDPSAEVRKTAVLVLASESDLVREDTFLPLLHDENAEVQFLCENALRKRGLLDDDIHIARLISDAAPATRMRVLHYLSRVDDLNVGSLLRQLSHDPSPAVRAAAVRAAAEMPHVDLSVRLREMAADDPSETVRQNANYYLQRRTGRVALD